MRLFDRMLSLVRSPLLVVILVLLAPQTIIAGVPIQNTLARIQGDGCQANQTKIQANIAELPLRFIANAGQADANVRFMVKAGKQTIFFTPQEVVFAASKQTEDELTPSSVIRLRFAGANGEVSVEGKEALPGVANFFLGNDPEKWRTDVPTYTGITYQNLYPGIDLIYSGEQGGLKSEFVVAVDADPTLIIMDYSGTSSMYVRADGALVLETPIGELVEEPPVIYQVIDGERVTVEGGYRLLGNGEVAFSLGRYVSTEPLIIDPVLVYSTYLGGSSEDRGYGIAVDGSGNVYVTGSTYSDDFPTQDPLQPDPAGDTPRDVFVAKLNGSGSALVYSTYLGGSSEEGGRGIAVDGSGNAYITGWTWSVNFPTRDPLQPDLGGDNDAFVVKLDASGSCLVYSTYLGGSDNDCGWGIAVDGLGNAYVTGDTYSNDFHTQDPLQPDCGGGWYDAFVAKLNPSGSTLVYSTYLGGSSFDRGHGIAVDGSGNVYVAGWTSSTDFPTQDALQPDYGGGVCDAFVAKLNASGSALVYSTYLGGSSSDRGHSIALDTLGNVYLTGMAHSDFPTKNALQPDYAGGNLDAFVTKLSASGLSLIYSTYLGGSNEDRGYGIAVDDSGNAYVTGDTYSNDFPTQDPLQPDYGGGWYDAFVAKLDASGSTLLYSTYLGGSGAGYEHEDRGHGIAVDSSRNAYVTGYIYSDDFPTWNPLQPDYGGSFDAFVVKIAEANGQVVSFPDPNLEQAIREAIDKPTGDIYESDLAELTSLDAWSRGIRSLEGIEHCTSLTDLMIYDNTITDLSPLSALTHLEGLYLDDNDVSDLIPITDLTNLESLDISGNSVSDLTPITGLANLRYLDLWRNEVTEVASLLGLIGLEHLNLGYNGISDIQTLENNAGLDAGDTLNLQYNYLNLTPGSDDMKNIQALIARGVDVEYEPQDTPENQPPDTRIVTVNTDSGGGTAEFTWTGNDDTTILVNLVYSYRLVRPGPAYDAWSSWSSGKTKKYTDLSSGNYRFQVRARDAELAIDPSPASREFVIAETPNHAPIARASDISGQPKVMYPDTVYTVTAKYFDPDGRADLKYCYLRLKHPTKPLTMMWCQEDSHTAPWAGEEGENYLSNVNATSTNITDGNGNEGYELTWTFQINGHWPEVENAIEFGVFASDDDLESGWDYDDTNVTFQLSTSPFAQQLEAFVERSSQSIDGLLHQVQGENGLQAISTYFENRVNKLARDELKGLMRSALLALFASPALTDHVGDVFFVISYDVMKAFKSGDSIDEIEDLLLTDAQQATVKMKQKLKEATEHVSELTEEDISEFSLDLRMRENAHRLLTSIIFSEKEQLARVKQAAEAGEPWEFVERLFSIPMFLSGRLCPYSWPVTLPLTVLSTLRTVKRMDEATVNWVATISALSFAEWAMMDIYENTIKALNIVISNETPAIPEAESEWLGHQLCDYDKQLGTDKGTLGAKASSVLWIRNRGPVNTGYKVIVTYRQAINEPLKVVQEEARIEPNDLETLNFKYTEAGARRSIMVGGQEIIVTRYTGTPPSRGTSLSYYIFMRTKTGLYAADIGDTVDWNWESFAPGCPSPDPDVEIPSVISIGVHSPVTLCVYDSLANVTGTLNGEIREEIPGSMAYEDGLVLLFDLTKTYKYVVTGTEQGTYGLTIAAVEEGQTTRFSASGIPTLPSGVHQYTIDWDALARGEDGAVLDMDNDGNGTFEETITADDELTGEEISGAPTGKVVTNGPNPVGGAGTAFFYTLPEGTSTAKLMIFNINGKPVFETALDVDSTRFPTAGTWNPVDTNGVPLANGPYIYVLVADGKLIGRGKMVIQR